VIAGGNIMITKEHFSMPPDRLAAFTGEVLGTILIAGACVAVVLGAATATGLTQFIGIGSGLMVLAIVTVSVGNAMTTLLVTGYQLSRRPGQYAAFLNTRTLVELGLSVILVAGFALSWRGRLAGAVITAVFSIVAVAWTYWSRGIRIMMPREYRPYIIAAAPMLILANMTGWVHDMSDRLVIAGMIDLRAAGLYAIAYRFGMVISVLETSFARAWQPFFFEQIALATPEARMKIVRTTYWYAAALVGVTAAYSLIAPWLMRIMVAEQYLEAASMIPIVCFGYCCAGLWKLFTGYLINAGQNTAYATTLAASAALNLVLSIALVSRLGYVGAAWGTAIAFAAGAIATAIMAQRACPMPWRLRPVET
jgi:O-antigen/teichoic acid export membrane protein